MHIHLNVFGFKLNTVNLLAINIFSVCTKRWDMCVCSRE